VPNLLELIPQTFGRYFEPFFGAGALFFALQPRRALLSDANSELMMCYRQLRDNHEHVSRILRSLPQDDASYYRIRSSVPQSEPRRAARLIYLTSLSFNGIYRVNLAGKFNVPYSKRECPRLTSRDLLAEYGRALATCQILSSDFEDAVQTAKAGDLVYLDPPYTVAHSNNGFVKYNDKIFSWRDQERLARVARGLDERGCHVIVSNAGHSSIRKLYSGFSAVKVPRISVIAANAQNRRQIKEYLFTNGR
jgi:DNA adenine methylase